MLEAKLVLGDGFFISIGTEFIENELEDVSKNDCETKAFKRLSERLKKEYPRLPVCVRAGVPEMPVGQLLACPAAL